MTAPKKKIQEEASQEGGQMGKGQTEAFICEKARGNLLSGPWSSWL